MTGRPIGAGGSRWEIRALRGTRMCATLTVQFVTLPGNVRVGLRGRGAPWYGALLQGCAVPSIVRRATGYPMIMIDHSGVVCIRLLIFMSAIASWCAVP